MAAPAVINIAIKVDSSGAVSGLKSVQSTTEKAGSTFKSTFGAILASGVVQKVASTVWSFGKDSVKAYQASEENAIKYANAMDRLPDASDAATKSLQDQAKALSKVTVYGAGATKSGQAVLAGFNLTSQQIKQLTPLMQDYATKTGKDLPSAAEDLGKAMMGQGKALKNIGINFKDTKTQAGNFAELTTGLESRVSGLSQTMGDTASGKMQIMQNQLKGLKVAVGAELVPVLAKAIDVGLKFVGFVKDNTSWLIPLTTAVIALVAALKIYQMVMAAVNLVTAANPIFLIVLAIIAFIAVLVLAYNKVAWFRDAVNAIWAFIQAYFQMYVTIIIAVVNALVVAWNAVVSALGVAWNVLRAAFNAVVSVIRTGISAMLSIVAPFAKMFALPFTIAWQLVQAAVTGGWSGVWAVLRSIPGQVLSALAGVTNAISSPFIAGFNAVKSGVEALWNWIRDKIEGIKSGVSSAINMVKDLYNPIARVWNGIEFKIPKIDSKVPGVPTIGGQTIGFPDVPLLARGAYVSKATLAVVGEGRGGELVSPVPLLRQVIRGELDKVGYTININVPETANPAETGRQVAKVLRSYFQAGGRLSVPA